MPDPFITEDGGLDEFTAKEIYEINRDARNSARSQRRKASLFNNIPFIRVTPEILKERMKYRQDYVLAHKELFPLSTGAKPFCPDQIKSVKGSHHIIHKGGNLVRSEPRSFGKTTRTANEATMAEMEGILTYVLIVASEKTKATEILDIIKGELVTNPELSRLYPTICECFVSLDANPMKGRFQSCNGKLTYIAFGKDTVVFPSVPLWLPGDSDELFEAAKEYVSHTAYYKDKEITKDDIIWEPSSGVLIRVRTKDNIRGVIWKPQEGLYKGQVLRPQLVMLDDIQTDEEANNPNSVRKIVDTINKAIGMSGTHFSPISAIMTGTPIALDDVLCNYLYRELGWSRIMYRLVLKEPGPKAMKLWMEDYAAILTAYDKDIIGDDIRAKKEAKEFYVKNRDKMEGGQVAWDWAYAWMKPAEHEISALQHAMNIRILKGEDVYQTECQCNVMYMQDKEETRVAPPEVINDKRHHLPEDHIPQRCQRLVAHVDVNKQFLTWMSMASPLDFEGFIISYGVYPSQPKGWNRDRIIHTLQSRYPDHHTEEEWVKAGLKHLLFYLSKQTYLREGNIWMKYDRILCDSGYLTDIVYEACREVSPICMASLGEGTMAKDKPFPARAWPLGAEYHYHCATTKISDHADMGLYLDTNKFKSQVHRGFLTPLDAKPSIALFQSDDPLKHMVVGDHCNTEHPIDDVDPKTERGKVIWKANRSGITNEWFDNCVGCVAGLTSVGCTIGTSIVETKPVDINEYMDEVYNNVWEH